MENCAEINLGFKGNRNYNQNLRRDSMKKIRIVSMVLFIVSLFVSIDLGFNFLWALVPGVNDGIAVRTFINSFGDRLWSYERFLKAFEISTWVTFVLLIVNITLSFIRKKD